MKRCYWYIEKSGVVLLLMAGVALSQTIASLQNVQVLNSLIQFDQKDLSKVL